MWFHSERFCPVCAARRVWRGVRDNAKAFSIVVAFCAAYGATVKFCGFGYAFAAYSALILIGLGYKNGEE